MNNKKFLLTGIALSVIVGLTACGGGSSTSQLTSDKNSSTTGPITAFGSILVNGVEYNTSNASILIDGNAATEANLRVGMMVTVKKSDSSTASSVSAGDEVEGIVISAPGTVIGEFNIMGQLVTVDENTIFESTVGTITDASMIVANNVVEAHGYSDGMGNVTATRIEVKAAAYTTGDELEVKGVITNHNGTDSFDIGQLTITYSDATTLSDLLDGIQDGLYVEAKSYEALDVNNQLIASKIEQESKDHDSDEDDEYEVKDLISELIPDVSITVANEVFLIDTDTEFTGTDDLSLFKVGTLVEVEGYYNSNKELVAKKVEYEDSDLSMVKMTFMDTVMKTDAPEANTGTITLSDGTVIDVNNNTIMKDNSDAKDPAFNLQAVKINDYLEIKAYVNNDGTYTAIKVNRENTLTGSAIK
jgi:hypothetical protein